METAVDPLIGRVIDGRYRLISVIAEGGMGVVYRAEHTVIGRKVAVKILRPELAMDVDIGERFLEEARAAGTLGHPNIVECTDFGSTVDDRPYLVMELLEGNDLAEELRRTSPFPVRRVVQISRQIASALAAAHDKHIVHRDLKPENVFVLRAPAESDIADQVKLLDFGISKFLNRPSGPKTQRGLTMGTPDFMAPEQITDPDRVDARSDVHALGGLMYEMLAGRSPFGGGSQQNVVMRILHQPPRPVTELRADVPLPMVALVMQCLAKDPDERPQTMADVLGALARILTATPATVAADGGVVVAVARTEPSLPITVSTEMPAVTSVRTDPALTAGAPITATPGPTSVGGTPSVIITQAPRSNRVLWGVGAIAAAALGGVAVLLAQGRGGRTESSPPPPAAAVIVDSGLALDAVATVLLEVTTAAPGAVVTVRGQQYPAPFSAEIAPGAAPELIEVTAPGHEGRRLWITLDRARYLDLALPSGAGIATASDQEVSVAADHGNQARTDRQTRGQSIARVTVPDRPTAGPGPGSSTPSTPSVGSAGSGTATSATGPGNGSAATPVTPTSVDASLAAGPRDAGVIDAAPATSPSGGTPTVAVTGPKPGTIDVAGVKAVMKAHASEVSACYERARMENHSQPLRGTMTVVVQVDGAGTPTATKVSKSTLGSSRLESCVASVVKGWRFPAPAGGVSSSFSYPFAFQ